MVVRWFVSMLLLVCASIGFAGSTEVFLASRAITLDENVAVTFDRLEIPGGESANGLVEISGPAPTGGFVVNLSSDNVNLTVPTTITIPAGQTGASFVANSRIVTINTPAVVTATISGFGTHSETVTVIPPVHDARFVEQSVQPSYFSENSYPVTVRFQNTGNTTWTPATHRLVSMNPYANTTWGRANVTMPSGTRVRPGESYTFAFNILAPSRAARYNFQWQLRNTGPGSPKNIGELSPNTFVNVISGDEADFISQSVPTFVEPGRKFDVQIVVQNRGSTTWTYDKFRLISLSTPAKIFGRDSIALNPGESVPPGGYRTYNFRLEAPLVEGNYDFLWQMRRSGIANFGDITPTVNINVRYRYNSAFVGQVLPDEMFVSRNYEATVTFRNTGVDTWQPGQVVLYSQNPAGNRTWGVAYLNLGVPVSPGEEVTFTIPIRTPSVPGLYNFRWRLRKNGQGDFGAFSTNITYLVEDK